MPYSRALGLIAAATLVCVALVSSDDVPPEKLRVKQLKQ
jgi:hypothetical protein